MTETRRQASLPFIGLPSLASIPRCEPDASRALDHRRTPAQRGLRQGDDGRFRRSGDRDWSWPEVLNFRPRTTADDVEVRRGG